MWYRFLIERAVLVHDGILVFGKCIDGGVGVTPHPAQINIHGEILDVEVLSSPIIQWERIEDRREVVQLAKSGLALENGDLRPLSGCVLSSEDSIGGSTKEQLLALYAEELRLGEEFLRSIGETP